MLTGQLERSKPQNDAPLLYLTAVFRVKALQKLCIQGAHVKAHGSFLKKLLKAGGIALLGPVLADPLDSSAVQLALGNYCGHVFLSRRLGRQGLPERISYTTQGWLAT